MRKPRSELGGAAASWRYYPVLTETRAQFICAGAGAGAGKALARNTISLTSDIYDSGL